MAHKANNRLHSGTDTNFGAVFELIENTPKSDVSSLQRYRYHGWYSIMDPNARLPRTVQPKDLL